jgi:predicted SAM-dependent methyltransferase
VAEVTRLNWGCGRQPRAGWINSDRVVAPGIAPSCDIRDGLPLATGSVDYAVAIHALQDVPCLDVPRVLAELHRVLRPGGVLRLALPDLDRAIDAYRRGDAAYFYVPDDEVRSIGGKLAVQITWYGSVRTPFTYDFIEELLVRAGFREIVGCRYRETASPHAEIVELDDRERESLFVEATK